jgi:hypothetical protein
MLRTLCALIGTSVMMSSLSQPPLHSCVLSDEELGLEPIHVAAKLTVSLGLSVQEGTSFICLMGLI